MIKNIVFDFGGVLVQHDFIAYFSDYFHSEEKARQFFAHESGKTKCARFEKRNVQKSGKTKRSKNFAHTTL